MPAIDIERDPAHDAAQRELAKPIYPKESLLQRFLDWLDRELSQLLDKGSTVPGGWFTISVLLVLTAIAVVVAVRIAQRAMRTNRGGEHQLFGTAELSADEHRATAERHAAAGDWAAAIRHRLRAVARHLEETGVLNAVPGRTANELARDAGAALPHLSAELDRAAEAFNDVTYGELPGTQGSYRLIADLDEHLRSRSSGEVPAVSQSATSNAWAQVR